jgi:hypothetical protein
MHTLSVESVFGERGKELAARKFNSLKQTLTARQKSGKGPLSLDDLARLASRHASGKIPARAFAEFLRSGLTLEQRKALEGLGLPREEIKRTAPKEPPVVHRTPQEIDRAYVKALESLPPPDRTIRKLAEVLRVPPDAVASYCYQNPNFASRVIRSAHPSS